MSNDGLVPKHWVEAHGNWDVADVTTPIYLGDDRGEPFRFGICLSDVKVTQGRIEVTVKMPDAFAEGRILFGYSTQGRSYYTAGLGGWESAYSIQQYRPDLGLLGLKLGGAKSNLKTGRPYRLAVDIRGSRVRLSIDGVNVLEHILEAPLSGHQTGLFTVEDQRVEFSDFRVASETGDVFVVMQFSEPYQSLYADVIKPVVESFGLKAHHIGEVFGPGVILQDIIQDIMDAKIIVVDVSPINANVYYELGYAHALQKPTVLLRDKGGEQLPFDISSYRTIFYENSIAGKKDVEDNLRKHFESILSN